MVKGGHRFAVRFCLGSEVSVLRTLTLMADDPAIPFDTFDAVVMAFQMGGGRDSDLTLAAPPKEPGE
jgi:hypothetical protein